MTNIEDIVGIDERLRPASSVHTQRLGAEIVLLDFANGEYFALDEVGAVVWECMENDVGASIREMAVALVAQYNVSHADALRDVRALTRELLARSLIVWG